MSNYTYNRYPREQFITYAKRKDYIIAKDLEVKDSQGRRLNNKDKIERYEEMMRFIRDGNVTIDILRDLKRLIELEKEKGMGGNRYMPTEKVDEICEIYQKFKETNNDRRIRHYYNTFPPYFVKEIEKFNKEEQTRKDLAVSAEKHETEHIEKEAWFKAREQAAVARYLAQADEIAAREEAEKQEQEQEQEEYLAQVKGVVVAEAEEIAARVEAEQEQEVCALKLLQTAYADERTDERIRHDGTEIGEMMDYEKYVITEKMAIMTPPIGEERLTDANWCYLMTTHTDVIWWKYILYVKHNYGEEWIKEKI